MTELHKMALCYSELGLKVFPIVPNAKNPATDHGFQDATTDVKKINEWWGRNPSYNIGIATGEGIVVFDLDEGNKKDGTVKHGIQNFENLKPPGTVDQPTWVCATPKGGKHIYYRRNSHTSSNQSALCADVDIRGDGGYIIAPPSRLPNGDYRWISPPVVTPIADIPMWLETLLQFSEKEEDKKPFHIDADIPEGQRTNTLVKMCGSMQAKGFHDSSIRAAVREENASRCNPPLTDDELERNVFPCLSRWEKGTSPYTLDIDFSGDSLDILERLCSLHPENNKSFKWTDAGNGNLYAAVFKGKMVYVPERKKWYFYDGTRWTTDTDSIQAKNYCKNLADVLLEYAAKHIVDEKIRIDYLKHANKWQSQKYRETILKDAATINTMSAADFDSDPYLFNCKNGTLNLRTMEFKEHNALDYISLVSGVVYNPDAHCERWERFISEVTCGDAELALFIQKALGYTLTGDTDRECFFILYGPLSRNGKGTLCETFMSLVGDYGKTASPESIAVRKYTNSKAPSEDIARLRGARFVNMSEPDRNMMLDSARVKTLTGKDTIVARFLNESSFEYKPQFKIFINTNYQPSVNDPTLFTSGRVHVIPFNRHFAEYERDTRLKDKLAAAESLSGILNWCIQGLAELKKDGFVIPSCIKDATNEYKDDSDKAGSFVDECLIPNVLCETQLKSVYSAYQEWCYGNGYIPESTKSFKKSLATAGIKTLRKRPKGAPNSTNKSDHILGYALKNPS